jgi:hypothetical protein
MAAYGRVCGRNSPDIAAADRPINFVAIIRRKNENIEFALTLFCEKDIMSPTVETQRSWNSPAATGPDVAQSLELYFPRVEDLLHRLANSETAKPDSVRAPRFGSWKLAAACAVGFICVPGYATPAGMLLFKDSARVPPTEIQTTIDPVPAKADRLPLIATATPANYFSDVNYFDEAKIHDEDDQVERPALRGSVEDIVFTAAAAEPPITIKPKLRRSIRVAFATMPVEALEPAPRTHSLLEKLFSVFAPQFSQPPSQRQM